MKISIGEVVSVRGTQIIISMDSDSNKILYSYDGEIYHGVALRELISIHSGMFDIICTVEGEFLDVKSYNVDEKGEKIYIRKVELKPLGYFESANFYPGVKYLPMIKDNAFLLNENELKKIRSLEDNNSFKIGKTLKDDIPYSISWAKLFNKHIGVFGNTGSGKSNTLTHIYTKLFDLNKDKMKDKSSFVVFDFNGEYTGDEVFTTDKTIIELNTKKSGGNKITLGDSSFWNADIICLLFKATHNTQKPFLKRVITGRKKYKSNDDSLNNYLIVTLKSFYSQGIPRKEMRELFINIFEIIKESKKNEDALTTLLDKCIDFFRTLQFNGTNGNFYYTDTKTDTKIYTLKSKIDSLLNPLFSNLTTTPISSSFMDELLIRSYLQLMNDLMKGYVQFDHISPLLSRISSLSSSIEKTISVSKDKDKENDEDKGKILTVISFRHCNQDIKKLLPIVLAKSYYEGHKDSINDNINKTFHLIIDEAHNILSSDSNREDQTWRDYRLDLFEEIIKEGRKFGVFLTVSSQRPADISPTIMSQFHNFFIHKLVNERDLALLSNTISTLDAVSKDTIPLLPIGACIITGVSFPIPQIVLVDYIKESKNRPNSDDVNLSELWS